MHRAEQHHATMFVRLDVAKRLAMPLSKVIQDTSRRPSSPDNGGIFCADQSFAMDGIGLVSNAREIIRKFFRKILIQLESHLARIGTRRSSCASSAA